MADTPSLRVQKKHRFVITFTGSVDAGTYTANANLTYAVDGATASLGATGNKLNLVERQLPIQGALVGAFGGAIISVQAVGLISAGGSGTVGTWVLQGSVDGSNWNDLTIASGSVSNVTAAASPGTTAVAAGLARYDNPLPQYLRLKFTVGTEAITAGAVYADVFVNG